MDPLQPVVLAAQKGDEKAKDQLFHTFKKQLDQAAVNYKYKHNIPEPVLKPRLYNIFAQTIENYKPEKTNDSKFSTYLTGRLQTMNSYASAYVGPFRAVGGKRYNDINELKSAERKLRNRLDTVDVSDGDLAAELKWPLDKVVNLRKAIRYATPMSTGEGGMAMQNIAIDPDLQQTFDYLYYDLGPDAKLVLEYITGLYSKPKIESTNEIARLTHMTPQKVSKIKNMIGKRIDEARRVRG